jgi:hypothetical protein
MEPSILFGSVHFFVLSNGKKYDFDLYIIYTKYTISLQMLMSLIGLNTGPAPKSRKKPPKLHQPHEQNFKACKSIKLLLNVFAMHLKQKIFGYN